MIPIPGPVPWVLSDFRIAGQRQGRRLTRCDRGRQRRRVLDADRHALAYRWWNYAEAGTLAQPLTLQGADGPVVRLVAPRVSAPADAHVILEVTDAGEPRVTSYRRVVLTITV